jgi:hypothetical protein
MKFYLKWFLIVGFNSISGFFWGYHVNKTPEQWLGTIVGVLTWYLIYLSLDKYLLKKGKVNASRKLVLSTSLRIPLQLTIYPDFFAGIAAIATCDFLGLHKGVDGFFASYCITAVTGLYLGVICLFLYIVVSGYQSLRNLRKGMPALSEQP